MGKWGRVRGNARAHGRAIGLAISAVALLALTSCESVNEGIADYRKADIDAKSAAGGASGVTRKYRLTGPHHPAGQSLPAGTIDSSDPGVDDVPIVDGNRFYVSLLQAFAGADAGFGGNFLFQSREELVVVLRVRDSNDPDSEGRFVFYSDDVKPNQFLNLSNLLTLGPTEYRGGVITIDLDEIRLKGSTSEIKEKLDFLTAHKDDAFGPDPETRKTWHSYARNVFNIIDSDIYGVRYTLTLLPAGGVAGLPYPRFEAGNYVIMRHRRGNPDVDWNNVQLNNNTGRLIYANHSPGQTDDVEFTDNSYVTIQINALRDIPRRVPNDDDKPLKDKPTDTVKPPKYTPLEVPPAHLLPPNLRPK